jgi:hypothetical protein
MFTFGILIVTSVQAQQPRSVTETAEYKKLLREYRIVKEQLDACIGEKQAEQQKEIVNSKALIYGNRISVQKIETGWYNGYHGNAPCVAIKFKNISDIEIDELIHISVIFIDNTNGEELGSESKLLTAGNKMFIPGTTKQIRLESWKGWHNININNKSITARIYVRNNPGASAQLIETVKIANRFFDGIIK